MKVGTEVFDMLVHFIDVLLWIPVFCLAVAVLVIDVRRIVRFIQWEMHDDGKHDANQREQKHTAIKSEGH